MYIVAVDFNSRVSHSIHGDTKKESPVWFLKFENSPNFRKGL